MAERVEVHEPFADPAQQHAADMLGMYIFLASEIMLFGGLFAVLFVCRILHPQEIAAASKELHLWIGGINTAILLTSSLAVAIAVQMARQGSRGAVIISIVTAAALGSGFLILKGIEYRLEYSDGLLPGFSTAAKFANPAAHLFMNIYLISTALHALHLSIGILLLAGLVWRLLRGSLPLPKRASVVEVSGLYWHLVDVIWIFLYPALYLVR
ncbi:cytochrome c oxidase subunit 3 [Dongia soli]|uniref:Cytochrome c oxidase subunit 3 n=1 Tax=Dongia soli TaxID=600628 RepID=A0ABU5EEC8_9PROT|nr:cytochrome c oxidase subunit 3 [Dongia soli]MDY0884419.1 cytochrome c oxidase subunit 3 [Dongia soli]